MIGSQRRRESATQSVREGNEKGTEWANAAKDAGWEADRGGEEGRKG